LHAMNNKLVSLPESIGSLKHLKAHGSLILLDSWQD
jgi:hypothetical protein